MKYFAKVCELNSITSAAEAMHISQQGLSAAIRRLENELGYELFFRRPSGLVLTEKGENFKVEVDAILKHVKNIYEIGDKSEEGNITVACTTNLVVRLPLQVQRILLKGTEGLRINYIENWTRDCENMVLNGDADVGIVYGECDPGRFNITTLDILGQVFITSVASDFGKNGEVSLEELAGRPMIVPAERCRPGQIIRNMFHNAGLDLNIVYTCDRPGQIKAMVSNDPEIVARVIDDDVGPEDAKSIRVMRLKDNPFLLPVCLITPKGKKLSMSSVYFKHIIMECFAKAES